MRTSALHDLRVELACGLAAIVLVSAAVGAASAQQSGLKEGQGGWITQFARDDVIRSFHDLELSCVGDRVYEGSPRFERVQSASLEIRSSDNARRVATLAVPRNPNELFSVAGAQLLVTYPWQNAPSVPDGDYACAFIVNGQRRSNVSQFTIDLHRDVAKRPLVRITQIEPEKAGHLPKVVAYVSRAKESDPSPDHMTVASGELVIDDVVIPRQGLFYSGPNGPLAVGGTYSYPLGWVAPPDLAKAHTVAARIGNGAFLLKEAASQPAAGFQQSAPMPLETGTPLADAWDKAAAALAPAPEVRPVLVGTLIDDPPAVAPRFGSGIRAFVLTLSNEKGACREYGFNGAFSFRNLPAGAYTLTCQPRYQPGTVLTVPGVTVGAGAADPGVPVPSLTLPFAGQFAVSGRIMHPDGTPAPKVEVAGRWSSDDGRMTFETTSTTDAGGTYSMRVPFAKNAWVSYRDGEKEVRIDRNTSGSASDVDFKLTK